MAAPGSYSLKWHGHGLHLNASVSSLYKSEAFTDIVLATSDGRYFSAHQFVLSSCSQYLQKMIMIGSSFKSLSKIVVILPPEIKHSTLNILLQYIYKGEAIVNHEQLPNIMKAAELLQISGLCLGKDKSPSISDLLNNSPNSEHVLKQQNKNIPQSPAEHKNTKETTKINHRILIPEVKYCEPDIIILNDANDNSSKSSTSSSVSKKSTPSKSLSPPRKKVKESCDISVDIQVDSNCHRNTEEDLIEEVIVAEEIQIKDEPIDWEEQKSTDAPDEIIKQEVVSEEEQEGEKSCYMPLTCDLCQETFTSPSLWVRHIEQSHPFTALASGRRNSKEETEAEYPPLHCELCQQVFNVPAEWVRHIQSHSEQQLAQENDLALNAADGSRGRVECSVCGKILQSQASMQIHARTHTGERPYLCKVCGREFNVKSNYLRHLRTLHDQLVHPSLVE